MTLFLNYVKFSMLSLVIFSTSEINKTPAMEIMAGVLIRFMLLFSRGLFSCGRP